MIVANKGFLVFLFCFVLFSGRFMYGTISVHGHVAELLGVGHTYKNDTVLFYGREFIGKEIEEYCEVGFEQHLPCGLVK